MLCKSLDSPSTNNSRKKRMRGIWKVMLIANSRSQKYLKQVSVALRVSCVNLRLAADEASSNEFRMQMINLCWWIVPASIDCNADQCAKPTKVYEELGCKPVLGSRSCCAKRFDCPDFKKLDDNKCTFEGKEYQVGESLPRNSAENTKCDETCICTRSAS